MAGKAFDSTERSEPPSVRARDRTQSLSPPTLAQIEDEARAQYLTQEESEEHDSLFSCDGADNSDDGLDDEKEGNPAARTSQTYRPSPSASSDSVAALDAPPIPGLVFFSALLSEELETKVLNAIDTNRYLAPSQGRNQAMLFGRARGPSELDETGGEEKQEGGGETGCLSVKPDYSRWREGLNSTTGLPGWADDLVRELRTLLADQLDERTQELLFPSHHGKADMESSLTESTHYIQPCRSRQLILNHYDPGEGITPHIDLPMRFGDGIILCSLQAGIAMDFTRETSQASLHASRKDDSSLSAEEDQGRPRKKRRLSHKVSSYYSLWLPRRSVLILSGEARWQWKHGIAKRHADVVEASQGCSDGPQDDRPPTREVLREERTSVTIRWLKPGADIVGG